MSRQSTGLLTLALAFGLSAVLIYREQRPIDPDDALEAALQARTAGDEETLLTLARTLNDSPAHRPFAAVVWGIVDLERGRLQSALRTLEPGKTNDQTHAVALTLQGEAFYRQQKLAAARDVLKKADRLQPRSADTQRWLASTYYDLGAMDLALTHLRMLASIEPADPRPLFMQAQIYQDYEVYRDAVTAYKTALNRNPQPELADQIRLHLAECLYELREYQDALAYTESLTDQTSESVQVAAWTVQARCQYATTQTAAAEASLTKALERTPDSPEALLLKTQILLDRDRADEALPIAERVADISPYDHVVFLRLSEVYRQLGQQNDAEQAATRAKELRDLQQEFADLHQQALNDTEDADLRHQIGLVALKLGRKQLAASWFRMALAIHPNHKAARQALENMQHLD